TGVGGREAERAVLPFAVVVVDGDAEHAIEVPSVEDEEPVETFGTDGADEALGDGVGSRRSHSVRIIPIPSLRKTMSKSRLYLLSRSRIRKRSGAERSFAVQASWRACWVTQEPLGFAEQP